jgi:hypothetical protein
MCKAVDGLHVSDDFAMDHIYLLAIAQKGRAWRRFGWPSGVFGPDLRVGHGSPIHKATFLHLCEQRVVVWHVL